MKAAWLVVAVALTGSAFAQEVTPPTGEACLAPEAPAAWAPGSDLAKVVPPKCLNLEKGTTTCSKKAFDGYNAQINAYNAQLRARIDAFNTYSRTLNAYVQAASDYSACQNRKARALMPFEKETSE